MITRALDTECTISNKGNPHDPRNFLVCYSWADKAAYAAVQTQGDWVCGLQHLIGETDLIVGFNIKHDLKWFLKYGLKLEHKAVWDVQLAEFIRSNQTLKLSNNSLNGACERLGIPTKLDVVKTEYWDKGINTDVIPWDVLSEYSAHDAKITLDCYHAQLKLMTPQQILLCKLQCQDLHILREMEQNGLPFSEKMCHDRAIETEKRIEEIYLELEKFIAPITQAK